MTWSRTLLKSDFFSHFLCVLLNLNYRAYLNYRACVNFTIKTTHSEFLPQDIFVTAFCEGLLTYMAFLHPLANKMQNNSKLVVFRKFWAPASTKLAEDGPKQKTEAS